VELQSSASKEETSALESARETSFSPSATGPAADVPSLAASNVGGVIGQIILHNTDFYTWFSLAAYTRKYNVCIYTFLDGLYTVAFAAIFARENPQRADTFHHLMFQRAQLGHDRDETRILALDADLFFNFDFFPAPRKSVTGFIVRGQARSEYSVS
jgi:hypothetical protein